jgi:hypothetical protein
MSRYVGTCTWDDVPHLSQQAKDELWASIPPFQRDARSKGVPQLGSGSIYPVGESDITCVPFDIPAHWKHVYAMDVGWNRTAVLWGALDSEADVLYLYSEHYRGQAEPAIHAQSIRARGAWIPGVIDPAARGRAQTDGQQLLVVYQELGLNLTIANNAVDAGIYQVWTRLSTGRLKVFSTLQSFFGEYRLYRRDEKGKIVKESDHLMDCCFAPETMVWTDKGLRPISALDGTSGNVYSIDGEILPYIACRMTGKNRRLLTVSFSDGTEIRCTPDHRFLTPNGWVPAIDLMGAECYTSVSNGNRGASWTQQLSTKDARSFAGQGIIFAENILPETGICSIERYGLSTTAGPEYQKVSMSITRTMIEQTTAQIISNWSKPLRICRATIRATVELLRSKLCKKLQGGTEAMKARYGTGGITRRTRIFSTSSENSNALNAALLTTLKSMGATNFAQTIARHVIGADQKWTMRLEIVSYAVSSLLATSTAKPKHAAQSATVFCLDVLDEGHRSEVYCLTVPKNEAFAVGTGGIIAHNCRYMCMSGIDLASFRPMEDFKQRFGIKPQHTVEYDPFSRDRVTGGQQQPGSRHVVG